MKPMNTFFKIAIGTWLDLIPFRIRLNQIALTPKTNAFPKCTFGLRGLSSFHTFQANIFNPSKV